MKFHPATRLMGVEKSLIRQITDLADSTCINLGLGEPKFRTPRPIIDHACEVLQDTQLGYTTNAGLWDLRQLIAERSGLSFDGNGVCVTVGAQEAMFIAVLSLVSPEDEVIITNPGFPAFTNITKIAGGFPVYLNLKKETGFTVRADDLEKLITNKTRLIILNSPSNPTGSVILPDELQRIADRVNNHRCYVLSDETYNGIYYEHPVESLAKYTDKALIVSSLSKTYSMTGWRLGWLLGSPDIIRYAINLHQYAVSCASTLSQLSALKLLTDPAVDAERERMRLELARRRALMIGLVDELFKIPYITPLGGFYLFADFSRWGPSLELARRILDGARVVTIPGIAFGSQGEGCLRLSFAASEEDIDTGLRRMADLLLGSTSPAP